MAVEEHLECMVVQHSRVVVADSQGQSDYTAARHSAMVLVAVGIRLEFLVVQRSVVVLVVEQVQLGYTGVLHSAMAWVAAEVPVD